MNEYIETNRLILKKLKLNDAPFVFQYMKDDVLTKFLYSGKHSNIEETLDFIRESYTGNQIDLFGIYLKDTNILIGHIAMLFKYDNNILWVLKNNYQNQGYAYEAAKSYIKYLFDEYDIKYLHASADIKNKSSINLINKLQMTQIEISEREYSDDREDSQEITYILNKNSYLSHKSE